MKTIIKYPGRLTERTADGILVKEDYGDNGWKILYQCHGTEPMPHYVNCDEGYCTMDKLAEYEDLEEQGKLLKLPCAVGDTVYVIKKYNCCPTGICRSEISCSECRELAPYRKYKRKFKFDDLAEIGKTVFLTREEAEAALNEMESGMEAARERQ